MNRWTDKYRNIDRHTDNGRTNRTDRYKKIDRQVDGCTNRHIETTDEQTDRQMQNTQMTDGQTNRTDRYKQIDRNGQLEIHDRRTNRHSL